MSGSRHSHGVQREVLRPRYEGQDSAMYFAQGTQSNFADFRTLDEPDLLHEFSGRHDRKYKPSYLLGSSSMNGQSNGPATYGEATNDRRLSAETIPFDSKGSRGRKPRSHNENIQREKIRAEKTKRPKLSALEPPKLTRPLGSETTREEIMRFSDEGYLDAGSPGRFPSTIRRQRHTPKGGSEDYSARALGNGDVTGEFNGGYQKSLHKRPSASERQRSFVPPAPIIPRLPTPDFDPTSHYELGLAKYDFCSCCDSEDGDEVDGARWRMGRAKMDMQVDDARAYMSQTTMSRRLIMQD
ncbi:hypothetical protein NUW58_g2010 [Xylaria curta]|uniref:Uncharacterized protein n=1 Tax=Xylaria curta TaxID=42375 RepID=A0ACC1PJE9_9PEZI|nr:hypothetical protein NUW58_g2010 [Xylaria curta]